jgi:hypothetical protein
MCDTLGCLSKNVKDKVLITKAQLAAHLFSKIHNMQSNPRVAWEHIRLLTGGITVHHIKKVTMAMKMADGNIATNDGKENMAVFGLHFDQIFDNHCPVDLTILSDIPQCTPLLDLNFPSPHHL